MAIRRLEADMGEQLGKRDSANIALLTRPYLRICILSVQRVGRIREDLANLAPANP